MNQGTIVVTYKVDKGQFDSAISTAEKQMKDFTDSANRAGSETGSFWSKLGDGVSSVSRKVGKVTWDAVKYSAIGAATATTGMLAAALHTGAGYNTLQQASRAALTTILGGAEAANAQMDKLDVFARTSPFAKQVFIQAQQQLLGFGLAANKVIPSLDAIQNAVAAVGGSNDDILNITNALATMRSQGKLSGETLQQLGQYGIDAASIIGQQMGMTGDQIRQMASKPGGIPADKVWDPLINGLDSKFGGAAANVKQTWVGATDRIKAAWRDLASTMTAPLIDPHGGGGGISFANSIADQMRSPEITKAMAGIGKQLNTMLQQVTPIIQPLFQMLISLANPLVALIGGIGQGLVQLLQTAMPGLQAFFGTLGSALSVMSPALAQIGKVLGQALGTTLKAIAPILPAIAKAFADIATALLPIVPLIADLVAQLLGGLAPILPVIVQAFVSLFTALSPLLTVVAEFTGQLITALAPILPQLATLLLQLIQALLPLLPPLLQLVQLLLPPLIGLIKLAMPIIQLLAGVIGTVLVVAVKLVVGVLSTLISTIGKVISWFGDMGTNIKNAAQGAWDFIKNAFNGIKNAVSNSISNVIDFIKGLPGSILNVLKGAGGWLVDIGKNMIQGLISGAGSLLKNIGKFFLDLIPGWIKGPFEKILGIHSPSTVFAGYGTNIMQGLMNGLDSQASSLVRNVSGVATSITNGFASSLNGGNGVIGKAIDGMNNLVSNGVNANLNPSLAISGSYAAPATMSADDIWNSPTTDTSGSATGSPIVQNNYLTNGVTVDQVNRSLVTQLRRA